MEINITASLLTQFVHCPRQGWLFYYNLKSEHNSESVKIWKHYHEMRYDENDDNVELELDWVKIDKIQWEFVEEFKKAKTELEWAKIQLLYYLWILRQKWVEKKWVLKFKENRDNIYVELDEQALQYLQWVIQELKSILESDIIPPRLTNWKQKPHKKCKWCSYFEYCWV